MFDDQPQTDFYDYYHSPSPSGSENNEDTHSGVSSASSANPQFQSPNMSVAQSFENLSFHSPNWVPEPLPLREAPSPPRLIMPEAQPPIIINAPEDNTDLGPSLHIVPATPVSGGGGVMNIASSRVQPRPWLEVNPNSNNSSRSPSPSHSHTATPPIPSRSPSTSPQPPYLYPQSRTRRKSDTSLASPNWEGAVDDQSFPQNQQPYQSPNTRPPTLGGNFTFGSSPSLPLNNGNINHASNAYLSPDHAEFNVGASGLLRRSKSDTGNAGFSRHRGSRSEDFRHVGSSGLASNAYLSPNSGQFLYPPPTAHRDFVHSQQQQQQQQNQRQDFLSGVSELLPIAPSISHSPSLAPSMLPPSLGNTSNQNKHYRRASSGTRSERGVSAGVWEGEIANHNRPSPYPTPNASPRGRLATLAAERQDEFNFSGMGIKGIPVGRPVDDSKPFDPDRLDPHHPIVVSKPNVTTGRTANASQKRRKQDATFICPVPGCGSTFTRSFNLKGNVFQKLSYWIASQ